MWWQPPTKVSRSMTIWSYTRVLPATSTVLLLIPLRLDSPLGYVIEIQGTFCLILSSLFMQILPCFKDADKLHPIRLIRVLSLVTIATQKTRKELPYTPIFLFFFTRHVTPFRPMSPAASAVEKTVAVGEVQIRPPPPPQYTCMMHC